MTDKEIQNFQQNREPPHYHEQEQGEEVKLLLSLQLSIFNFITVICNLFYNLPL
jgi:hypothetical protein